MKSLDLLLTHGYFLHEDPKELQIMKPYAPLGILYLTSYLRSKGFCVEVFDSTFSSLREVFKLLSSMPPAVLGVYATLMTRRTVVEILRVAKEAGWQTIVGGPEPAAYISEYLKAGADVVVVGEGEVTLEELLSALPTRKTADLKRIDGIAFRDDDGTVYRTAPRTQISDLDQQPWPCRNSISIEKYLETWRTHHNVGSVSIITARGCPYHCRWCSHAVYGKTHRRRKPALVVDELEWILNRYSPDMLWIADDVFTIHHGWIFDFLKEMKLRGLKIPFECISRADRLNERIVDALAELGCFRVWIGSESGSQRLLDAMERGVTVEQVQTAVRLCKSRSIQTGMFLMWGYEGEGLQDIEATMTHVKQSDPDIFFTTVAYPIKGTPYFDEVAQRVVSDKPWVESSDREFRVAGRHSRRFYQYADQVLHAEVELSRLMSDRKDPGADPLAEDLRVKIAQAREGMRSSILETEA